jgi:hypothetical protein
VRTAEIGAGKAPLALNRYDGSAPVAGPIAL